MPKEMVSREAILAEAKAALREGRGWKLPESSPLTVVAKSPEKQPKNLSAQVTANSYIADTHELLRDVEAFFRRFVVLPEACYLPLLPHRRWQHTFSRCSMRSGMWPCNRPSGDVEKPACWKFWNVFAFDRGASTLLTPAVIFRKIGAGRPTLLLDEIEILNGKQKSENTLAIIAILNAGYHAGAVVARCRARILRSRNFRCTAPKCSPASVRCRTQLRTAASSSRCRKPCLLHSECRTIQRASHQTRSRRTSPADRTGDIQCSQSHSRRIRGSATAHVLT